MSELGQRLIQIVRQKAAENPDFVYYSSTQDPESACLYVKAGQPSCLIGQALWEAGVIDSSLEKDGEGNTLVFKLIAARLDLPIDPVEKSWLSCAQLTQDERRPWGSAVKRADESWGSSLVT